MEIAFFSDSYLPVRDGVAIEVHALARALRRLGHDVTVFAPRPSPGPGRHEELDGIEIVRLRSVPVPIYAQYRSAILPILQGSAREFRSRADVVHVHSPGVLGTCGLIAARRFHRPLVGTFHTDVYGARESFGAQVGLRFLFGLVRWYSLGLYYRCDVATAPTAPAREALLAQATKPFRRPIEVVPNGIELDRFRPHVEVPDWRTRCGFSPGPLLTFLGRLTVDKGLHRFLDALHALPAGLDWRAIVGGVGPEEASLRERLSREPLLRDRVRYVGPVAEEEKPALLAQSDLFVLPSTADTASIAVLEAMASGAVCVVSNIGGPSALVQDGRTGRVVSVERTQPLSQAIGELLTDPDERRRIARTALGWVQQEASIETTARRFVALYRALADDPPEHLRRVGTRPG